MTPYNVLLYFLGPQPGPARSLREEGGRLGRGASGSQSLRFWSCRPCQACSSLGDPAQRPLHSFLLLLPPPARNGMCGLRTALGENSSQRAMLRHPIPDRGTLCCLSGAQPVPWGLDLPGTVPEGGFPPGPVLGQGPADKVATAPLLSESVLFYKLGHLFTSCNSQCYLQSQGREKAFRTTQNLWPAMLALFCWRSNWGQL